MKGYSLIIASALCMLLAACGNEETSQPETDQEGGFSIDNPNDKLSYALGVNVADNVKRQGLEEVNPEAIAQGFADYYADDSLLIAPQEAIQMLQQHFQGIQQAKTDEAMQEGLTFLAQNASREEVTELPSGLQYEVLKEGNGPKPALTDKVKTHYHGTLIDGTVFDSSVERGEPISFAVQGVIPGWTEALQLMPVGSKWKLYIPSNLAYGPRGQGQKIGPNSTLIFEIELLAIE